MKRLIQYLASAIIIAMAALVILSVKIYAFDYRANFHGSWESVLVDQLYSANQINVQAIPGDVIFSSSDSEDIRSFLRLVEVNESESGNNCFCSGSLLFTFEKDNESLGSISFHHEQHLRWKDGYWPGDAVLTTSSKNNILQWLRERNIHNWDREPLPNMDKIKKPQRLMMNFWDMLHPLGLWGAFVVPASIIILLGSIVGLICNNTRSLFYTWLLGVCIKLNVFTSVIVLVFGIAMRSKPIVWNDGVESATRLLEHTFNDMWGILLLLVIAFVAFVVKSISEVKQKLNANQSIEAIVTTPVD